MKNLMKLIAAAGVLTGAAGADAQVSNVRPDEEILFFPGIARQAGGGGEWELEIRGLVCEPERRRLTLSLFREAMDLRGIARTAEEDALFNERARYFMVDNERDKEVVVTTGGRRTKLEETGANGFFAGKIRLTAREFSALRQDGTNSMIPYEAVLRAGDVRRFAGEAHVWERSGLTVISDIDDTIKLTNVRDRSATLRNTFLRPFEAVPGMAELYRGWSRTNGARFFYLSASPWQLYVPLSEFAATNGFPPGVFQLKTFRWKDETFYSLFADPFEYKTRVLEPLLERFPERRYVLVGDSGEQDPEIYAALARKYPRQVIRILIRDVTEEAAESARYRRTFRELPRELWEIFRDPAGLRTDDLPAGP